MKSTYQLIQERVKETQRDNKRLEQENKLLRVLKANLELKIEQLQQRIDKAINYINKFDTFQIIHSTDEMAETLRKKTKQDLLSILQGEDN